MSVSLQAIEPGIAVLQVDRPAVRNALNWDAIHAFRDRIEAAHALEDLRALIITGSDQAFIAGGDLKELHGYSTAADGEKLSSTMRIALDRLEALPCPTIAAMNGPAAAAAQRSAWRVTCVSWHATLILDSCKSSWGSLRAGALDKDYCVWSGIAALSTGWSAVAS